jgi:arsenite methyltransferase
MKSYLIAEPPVGDRDFISCIDELPLWSAPFGLSLLDTVEMKAGIRVLDIGCGFGFPLIELAQRLGNSCRLVGIDPWEAALDRVRLKLHQNNITNVEVSSCGAEKMPFGDGTFNLIVSNNGLNNVQDLGQSIRECSRVAACGAQLVLTQNLGGSMAEFYTLFEKVLAAQKMFAAIKAMKEHIYHKRRPVDEIVSLLEKNQFRINTVVEKGFSMRFLDADALFNHSLIRFWFAGSWKEIAGNERLEEVFTNLELELNTLAQKNGFIRLSIPYVVMECRRK